jgi:hypothetical protein
VPLLCLHLNCSGEDLAEELSRRHIHCGHVARAEGLSTPAVHPALRCTQQGARFVEKSFKQGGWSTERARGQAGPANRPSN